MVVKELDISDGKDGLNSAFKQITIFKKLGDSSFKGNNFKDAIYYYENGLRYIDKVTQDYLRMRASKAGEICDTWDWDHYMSRY